VRKEKIVKEGSTTLILGAGFGGIALARHLRSALPEPHRIRLVDRRSEFHMGTTKTWVMLDQGEPETFSRPLRRLSTHGIEVVQAEVLGIDLSRRAVTTSGGAMEGDFLVIALGAELDMSAIPGLAETASSFYRMPDALRLRERLRRFDGGDLVLLIPRAPFQCPPAPYEGAMLLHSLLQDRGIRGRTRMHLYTIEKAPMATAGPEIGKHIVAELEARSISFHPGTKVSRVEARAVVMEDGSRVPFDLLIAIPPHVSPRVVREGGLAAPGGWIPVDPGTMEISASHGGEAGRVFAIGDTTSVALPGRFQPETPLFLPKAGVFAEGQGAAAAAAIAARVFGGEPEERFEGRGFCFIETGSGRAMRGDGDFFHLPHPLMSPHEPDERQYAEKKEWVASWMDRHL
jgi:sulfide:quinone oxidoreductase